MDAGGPAQPDRTDGESAAVVGDFLERFSGEPEALTSRLDADVLYRAADLEPVRGRLAVERLWRRLFRSYAAIEVSPVLMVEDGDIVLARQRQTFRPMAGELFELNSVAVFVVRDGRIIDWRDVFAPGDLPADHEALWRRLWRARW